MSRFKTHKIYGRSEGIYKVLSSSITSILFNDTFLPCIFNAAVLPPLIYRGTTKSKLHFALAKSQLQVTTNFIIDSHSLIGSFG